MTTFARLAPILAGLLAAPASAQPIGTDAAACGNAQLATALVRVSGFKSGIGNVRVQAYGPRAADFLKKGKWVRRIDVPLAGRRSLEVCVRLPAPGPYAIAVRHDANANGESDWNDGGGFSRNPKVSLLDLRPSFGEVATSFARGNTAVRVVMNYRYGLTIRPVR